MKPLYSPFIFLSLVLCALSAMGRQMPSRDKQFFDQEIARYKALIRRTPASTTSDESIDATYYRLNLKIQTSPAYLYGDVLMKAKSLQDNLGSITLDLMSALTVDSILVSGTSVPFVQSPSWVSITLDRAYNQGELMTVEVIYHGVPGSSGFGSFEFSSHSTVPWVWSLSEPYGAKDWWPSNDHPSDKADSSDMIVTCDSSFRVGSNGRLVSTTLNGDGTVTYHWQERHPISTYLISVAMTNYAQFTNWFHYTASDSMPVLNYVLPEHLSTALADLPKTIDMLTVYSRLFGLYPFADEKYGHSEFGWGGGMEHQTMTSVGGFGESLVAHELAHQWFGDMITCRTWADIWLNEGFATYCEAVYEGEEYGPSSYWNVINSDSYSAKGAVGTVHVSDTADVNYLFDWDLVYAKGAWTLHMLRHVLGDTLFFRSMYNYAHDPRLRFGNASTADFKAVCESTASTNLDYFFNEWIFGEQYPHYSYGWTAVPDGGHYDLTLGVNQSTGTTNPPFFTMPVDVKIIGSGWDTTVTVWNNMQSQSFAIQTSHQPLSVKLDPNGWILNDQDTLNTFLALPSQLGFDSVYVYDARQESLVVSNGGATTLIISSAATDDSSFAVSPATATIAPGTSTAFIVTFSPRSLGAHTATLSFTDNAPGSPHVIPLTGFGVERIFTVSTFWNLVSLPVTVADPQLATIFPGAARPAFEYQDSTGYAPVDSLLPGIGYWVRYDTAQAVIINGTPLLVDTLSVKAGWNLIGSLSNPVSVGAIGEQPAGIVISRYFGYSSSYQPAVTLQPLGGYWVKTSADGTLILSAGPASAKPGASASEFLPNVLTFTNADGISERLYFGSEKNMMADELPPLPPKGGFDVRFSSNSMSATLDGATAQAFPVRIMCDRYPITISWSVKEMMPDAKLDVGEKEIPLRGEGQTLLDGPAPVNLLAGGKTPLPSAYVLEQNWPNPFNPSTTIRYALPFDSHVRLSVLNILGQEVAVLIDGQESAGYRSITWDGVTRSGTALSSGVYFYRILATANSAPLHTFDQIRKMILMK